MASVNFEFTEQDGKVQYSQPLTVSQPNVRVRFQRYSRDAVYRLEITGNGVTTFVNIDNKQAWATGGLSTGDVARVQCILAGVLPVNITGVLEEII